MDAKTFFRSIRDERREIRILKGKIHEAELEILPKARRYDLAKVQTSITDGIGGKLTEIGHYEVEKAKHIAKLEERQSRAMSMISCIPSSEQRQVMEAYYLDDRNPTWDDVADLLAYSKRSVLGYHGKALMWLNEHMAAFME